MGFPIDGNLHRVADDLLQLACSVVMRKAGLHGGEVLQREGDEVGENEQQWMAGVYTVGVGSMQGAPRRSRLGEVGGVSGAAL
jgi:hypothetical protein